MTTFDKLYIDGAWIPSDSTETIEVIDSVTEDTMATIPAGSAADVDRAVGRPRRVRDVVRDAGRGAGQVPVADR